MWTDQTCVNQGFHEERCHQVNQMGKLYSIAEATIVWPYAAPTEQSQIVRPVDKRGWTIPITEILDMQEIREEFDTWLPVGELDSDKLVCNFSRIRLWARSTITSRANTGGESGSSRK